MALPYFFQMSQPGNFQKKVRLFEPIWPAESFLRIRFHSRPFPYALITFSTVPQSFHSVKKTVPDVLVQLDFSFLRKMALTRKSVKTAELRP